MQRKLKEVPKPPPPTSGSRDQRAPDAVSQPPQGEGGLKRDRWLRHVSSGDARAQPEQRILGEHVSRRLSALMHGSSLEVLIRAGLGSC